MYYQSIDMQVSPWPKDLGKGKLQNPKNVTFGATMDAVEKRISTKNII